MLDVGVYPLLLIISTPLFIQKLGSYEFGIWVFINSIIASLGILNIGLGDATIKYVSKYLALEDIFKVNNIIRTTFTIYLILVSIILIIGLVILEFDKHLMFLNIDKTSYGSISKILKIAVIIFGLKLIEQIFLSVFKGFQRYDIAAALSLSFKSIILVSNIFLAIYGFNLYDIFVVSLFLIFFSLILEAFFLKKFHPSIIFLPGIDKETFNEVINFGVWSWGQSILGIIAGQIDKFIVVYFAGMQVLAYYSIGLNVATQIHMIFAAAIAWIFPKISNMVERGEEINLIYSQLQKIVSIFGIILLALILYLKYVIFENWLGDLIYSKSEMIIEQFLLYESLMLVTIVPYYFLNAIGKIKLNTFLMVITLILKSIFIPLFFYFLGLKGLVVGQIFSLMLCIPLQIYFIHDNVKSNRYFLKGLMVLFPSFVLILGTFIYKIYPFIAVSLFIVLTINILYTIYKLVSDFNRFNIMKV